MITLKSDDEIELMRYANRVVAEVWELMKELAKPGVTTKYLDRKAEDFIKKRGCKPAFKGYYGYPATICASVNDQVVHGIPGNYSLKEGDILSVDVGTIYKGYYGDGAITIPIGKIKKIHQKLIDVTRAALNRGIEMAKDGNRIGDISHAIQSYVEENGFSVVRDFVGHGIGKELHEDPQVPNFGEPGKGEKLLEGMTIAIEPMVNEKGYGVKIEKDGWTVVTKDGGYSAHFEHTILIKEDGAEILTKV